MLKQRDGITLAAITIGIAATLVAYYPGTLSNDSITTYKQVIGGYWTDVSPVLMRHLWWLTDQAICGPGGMLLLHVAAWWIGIGLVAAHIFSSPWLRCLVIFGLGFFPPVFGLLAAMSVDVGMTTFGTLAIGLLLRLEAPKSSPWLAVSALLALFYGGGVRHNSFPAILPLLFILSGYFVARNPLRIPERGSGLSKFLVFLCLAGLCLGVARGVGSYRTTHIIAWAATPFWDLAAISLEENRVLLPASALVNQEPIDLPQLQRAFSPYSVSRIYWGEDRIAPYIISTEVAELVVREWASAVRDNPGAYARHRWRATRRQFGLDRGNIWGKIQFRSADPELTAHCSGMFPSRFVETPLRTRLIAGLNQLGDTWLYLYWTYFLLGLLVFLVSWKEQGRDAYLARWIAASGLLYVAPLPVILPGIDFRYCLWLIPTSLVSALLLARSRVSKSDPSNEDGGSRHSVC